MSCNNSSNIENKTTTDAKKTQVPHMGTALRYYLKRYGADLIQYAQAGDRVADSMLQCIDHLLIESDRLEGESYE
jgi:hypothetical protein